jgi:hypothetical protein
MMVLDRSTCVVARGAWRATDEHAHYFCHGRTCEWRPDQGDQGVIPDCYTADLGLLAGLQVSWWLAWSPETLLVMFDFQSAVDEYALCARYIVGVGFVLLR